MTLCTGCHIAVEADLSTAAFSLSGLSFIVASWSVIRRPSARSTFAPSASLLKLSVFSCVGAYRCCCKRSCSKRSKPCVHSLISATRGSLVAVLPIVLVVVSEAAVDEALKVEKRLEVRFEATWHFWSATHHVLTFVFRGVATPDPISIGSENR